VGEPKDESGFAMRRNQQKRRKCGNQFKSDTMLVFDKTQIKES